MTHGEDFISALSPKLEVTGCAYGTFFPCLPRVEVLLQNPHSEEYWSLCSQGHGNGRAVWEESFPCHNSSLASGSSWIMLRSAAPGSPSLVAKKLPHVWDEEETFLFSNTPSLGSAACGEGAGEVFSSPQPEHGGWLHVFLVALFLHYLRCQLFFHHLNHSSVSICPTNTDLPLSENSFTFCISNFYDACLHLTLFFLSGIILGESLMYLRLFLNSLLVFQPPNPKW